MKKNIILWSLLLGGIFAFSSCKEKIKDKDGVVTSVSMSQLGDTLYSMKIFDGKDTLVFSLRDAEYDNGVMLKDDQVTVHYIKGNGDTLRALLVYVKPSATKTIEIKPDTTKELLSR